MPDDPRDAAGEEAARKLISLAEAAALSGLSKSHLRLLIRQRKIWGKKMGRDWLTTEAAVKQYLASERHPGPKPKQDKRSA